jgi:hypothetical protein
MVMPITATTVSGSPLCVLPEVTADLGFDAGRRSFNLVLLVSLKLDFFRALSLSRFMTFF